MGLNFCNLSPYGLNLYNNLHFSLHLCISPSTALTTAIIVCHTKLVVLFPMHFFAGKISMSFGLRVFHFSAWICTLSRATALKHMNHPLLLVRALQSTNQNQRQFGIFHHRKVGYQSWNCLYVSHPNPSLCIHTRAVSVLTGHIIPFISCTVKRCNKSSFYHLGNSSIFKKSSSFVCCQSLKRFKNSRASSFRSVWSNNHSLSHFPVRHSENLSPFAVNCLCHFSSFVGVTKKEQRSQAICLISRM